MCQKLSSENRDKLPISERPVEGEGASENGPHADWNLGPAPTGKIYEAPVPDGTAPPVRSFSLLLPQPVLEAPALDPTMLGTLHTLTRLDVLLATQAPPDEKPPSSRHNPDAWMSGRSFKLDMPETLSAYKGAPPQVGPPPCLRAIRVEVEVEESANEYTHALDSDGCAAAMRPQVYGVLWNPYAEHEFITYGVKHLVTWRLGPDPNNPSGLPRWQSIAGTFGPTKVENVLAAAYVPDCMDKYRVRVDMPACAVPVVGMDPTASNDSDARTAVRKLYTCSGETSCWNAADDAKPQARVSVPCRT